MEGMRRVLSRQQERWRTLSTLSAIITATINKRKKSAAAHDDKNTKATCRLKDFSAEFITNLLCLHNKRKHAKHPQISGDLTLQ